MTEKSYAERIRGAVQSLHEQNSTAIKLCMKDIWAVLDDVKDTQDAITADRAQWDQEKSGWLRERNLLQSATRAAEQREGKVQDQIELERRRHADEMQQASDEISRLRGLVDVGLEAFSKAQEGANSDRRLAQGLPAFRPSQDAPNRPERGYLWASIVADAKASNDAIENFGAHNHPNPLPALAELAKDHRPTTVDTKRLESDLPTVRVTPEARALASAGT